MPYKFPENLESLTPYDPIEGEYKIRLDANESSYNLSDVEMKKITEAILKLDFNRYPDHNATKVSEKFAQMYNINKSLITAGNGSDELIALIVSTLVKENANIAVFENDFSMYRIYAQTYNVNCSAIPKNYDLTINVENTIKYINENNIEMLIFSNPCNPTSLGLVKSDVLKIITQTDALIILDEAYMDFWNESLLSEVEKHSNLIILKTCSKAIGLASIRLGFAVANEKITRTLKSVKSPYNVNSVTQKIGEIILSNPEHLNELTKEIVLKANDLMNKFIELNAKKCFCDKIYHTNTNFVFVQTKFADVIYNELLKNSIAIRKMGNYLRISTGNEEENQELISCLEKIIINLK